MVTINKKEQEHSATVRDVLAAFPINPNAHLECGSFALGIWTFIGLCRIPNYSGSQRGLGLQGSGLKNAGLQGSKTKISGLQGSTSSASGLRAPQWSSILICKTSFLNAKSCRLCINQFQRCPSPPPPRATAGHLLTFSVSGVGH